MPGQFATAPNNEVAAQPRGPSAGTDFSKIVEAASEQEWMSSPPRFRPLTSRASIPSPPRKKLDACQATRDGFVAQVAERAKANCDPSEGRRKDWRARLQQMMGAAQQEAARGRGCSRRCRGS